MNTSTKLILVEGLPGSGKTTTATLIAGYLEQRGKETALFLEGDLNHPADFESVACLNGQEFATLKSRFPDDAPFLEQHLTREGDDYLFRYRLLEQNYPHLSPNLIDALAQFEIYELPVPKFQRLLQDRWQRFAEKAAAGSTTYVFECCFLQNPITMLMARHNETAENTQRFILELAEIVKSLSPRLLYLLQADIQAAVEQVARERPQAWLDFVMAYHTQQGHGKAQGWQGFEGLINFYKMRQAIELSLLPNLPFPHLLVLHATWAEDEAQIAQFLAQT
ncbi:MAG: hypothetical protein WAM60_15295 [Candidatus Promineifilaceae bacterium]